MNFKLDENFGTRAQGVFLKAGHEVHTVRQEELQGASDTVIYEKCCTEQLCLVTLDLDFSDVLRFPPEKGGGIVVIRLPRNPSIGLLEKLVQQFLTAIQQSSLELPIEKRLWIVEWGRIRIHQSASQDDL